MSNTPPYFNLEWKVEYALRELVLAANRDGVPVYMATDNKSLGHADEDNSQALKVPYIMCTCGPLSSDEPGQNDGVMRGEATVEVFSHKHDEPGGAHADRVAWVRDVLMVDDLPDQLSGVGIEDFHCFIAPSIAMASDATTDHFRSTITMTLVVAASDA